MFNDTGDKVTVYRRKRTPEEVELQRIGNERWAKAKAAPPEQEKPAGKKVSSTPIATAK